MSTVLKIVDQNNFQLIAVGKRDHAFDELSPTAGVFWTVVQVDDQLPDGWESRLVGRPPMLDSVGNKVTGFPGGAHGERQQPTDHLQQAKWD